MAKDKPQPRSPLFWHDRSPAEISDGTMPRLEDDMIHGWMTMDGTVYSGDGYPVPTSRFRLDTTACAALLVRRPATTHDDRTPSAPDLVTTLSNFADRIDRYGFVNALPGHAETLRAAIAVIEAGIHTVEWFWTHETRPDEGKRVVVLYEDGSGALIGYWTGDDLIDADGEEIGWREDAAARWAYLPRGFELWCETRDEDAFTFPEPPLASSGERS